MFIPLMATGSSGSLLPGGVLINFLIVGFGLILVAFFSSSEASLISVNKSRIKHLTAQGNKAAKSVLKVVEQHEKFFAAILLTENAFIILSSSVGTALTIYLLGQNPYSVLLSTVIMTLLVVIFGEITPKSLAARFADKWSLVVGKPIQIIMAIETPFLFPFTILPKLILKMIGGDEKHSETTVTEGELRMLIGEAEEEGMVETEEAKMLESVFRFGDRKVSEIMTPRNEIIFLNTSSILKDFFKIYSEHQHTRFPVFKNATENIVGIISAKDVLKSFTSQNLNQEQPITTLIRDAYFVPENKRIAELLSEARQTGNQMAIAIDEFGGLAGLVSIKRLMEEVMGRIGEEGSSPEKEFQKISENIFLVDGSISIEEAIEEFGIKIPDGEYETIAGFIIDRLGAIPSIGDVLDTKTAKFEITVMDGLKIQQTKLSIKSKKLINRQENSY